MIRIILLAITAICTSFTHGFAADDLHIPRRRLQRINIPGHLINGPICLQLQQSIIDSVGSNSNYWSMSFLDERGQLIADLNGIVPRVPASNQKLISTAYALDKLGPDFQLKTKLLLNNDGSLELVGEGDPDLSISELQRFAMVALGQGGSRGNNSNDTPVKLIIREEPRHRWWPEDWDLSDRNYSFAAPVTRLALTSNALKMAVKDPALRLKRVLLSTASQQGGKLDLVLKNTSDKPHSEVAILHSELSAPMHALLSLANTESHNFTAEVLLREAANQWDVELASISNTRWIQSQGLPIIGLRIHDGSGLSRSNRVTTQTLAALLWHMDLHPYASYYQASMAIAGQRGTLRNIFKGTSLEGRFRGKTGTLKGVRSISGVLETNNGKRYVSLISNGAEKPDTVISSVLKAAQRFSRCPLRRAIS